jgi:hypothetical protein
MMDEQKLFFIDKVLNTSTMLGWLGKNDDGENFINRFEVQMTELPKDKNKNWLSLDNTVIITMYLNTDLNYISCDDLYYNFNVDTAWWEAHIIPEKVFKLIGIDNKANNRKFYIEVVVKSKDGKHTYCEEHS